MLQTRQIFNGIENAVKIDYHLLLERRKIIPLLVAYWKVPLHNAQCITCQEPGGKLRTFQFVETDQRILEVIRKLEEPQFFLCMNNISSAADAVANDVKHHLNCWVKVQRNISRVLADIEIVYIVDYLVHEANTIIDMNSLNTTSSNN